VSPIAFTTPRTWVAAEIVTAANLNTHLRDNIAWMATDSPACRAYKAAVQSVANATNVALLFDTERFDNAAFHSVVTNTSRFTVPTGAAGKYIFGSSVYFTANAGGTGRSTWWELNATTRLGQQEAPINATTNSNLAPTSTYALAAADYIETKVNQNSGGALNVGGAPGPGAEMWSFWQRT